MNQTWVGGYYQLKATKDSGQLGQELVKGHGEMSSTDFLFNIHYFHNYFGHEIYLAFFVQTLYFFMSWKYSAHCFIAT